jgi:hypothetical protein
MRTTISINDNVLERAKKLAREKGKTLSSVIEDALQESISRREQQSDRPRVTLPIFKGDGLQPGVDLDNNAALLDLMEEGDAPF